jgi:hypothetical protein
MLRQGADAKRPASTSQRRDHWEEHPILMGIAAVGIIIILGYITVVIGFWWGSLPPKRPSTVLPEAVWTWGPGGRHGHWILCSVKETGPNAQCKIWSELGNLDFEGDFSANRKTVLYPTTRLGIDARITGPLSIRIRNTLVPIIYLTNHKFLIPIEAHPQPLKI